MKNENINIIEEGMTKYGQIQKILDKKIIMLGERRVEVRIIQTQGYKNKKRWTTMVRARFLDKKFKEILKCK